MKIDPSIDFAKRLHDLLPPPVPPPPSNWPDTVHIRDVWQAGFNGEGIGIATLDSGLAPHPDVLDRTVAFQDFIHGRPEMYDDNNHGTGVATLAAGNGKVSDGRNVGAAPGAHIAALKVGTGVGQVLSKNVVSAIEWAIENRQRYNIRVLNMSFVLDDPKVEDRLPVLASLQRAVEAGIIPVVGAGNDGPKPNTIQTLASWPHAIVVAAIDDGGTPASEDDKMATFSSQGPGEQGQDKPDVAAPGVNIAWGKINRFDQVNVLSSGTSVAAPIVSGIIADWLQANPRLDVDDVQAIIKATSHPLPGVPRTQQGAGVIDAAAGLQMALELKSTKIQ